MSEARISVLLPVRDAEATLSACLRSIARQSEPRFECVIVDDGSRDASAEIAADFARRDPRFRVLREARRGLIAALQRGASDCRAPLVARMDADDCMDHRRLECQRDALEDATLSAVGCHPRLFPRSALGPGMRAYEQWLSGIDSPRRVREEAFVECPIAHPTLMIRRAVLEAVPYREVDWPEDYDLLLRLLEARHRIGVVAAPLLAWRHHPGRLSSNHPRYAQERFTACKAEYLARGFLARRDSYLLWGYGGTGRSLARALSRHAKRPQAIVEVHPRRLGRVIQGAPVISPGQLGAPPRAPLLVSVAGAGPRSEIRASLRRMGWREGVDYLCAA